jgi:tripartite-type tricarboxylate transporter receptor subunit TctC
MQCTGSWSRAALALFATTLMTPRVDAQPYPTRPIRWIVPVPAGSTTDIVTRLVAQKMNEGWGQQVVVDNRPGGVFTVGSEIVAKAPSDGYTIGTLLTPHVVNPFVLKNLPYNTERDFTPVSLMVIVPGVMTMYPALGVNNLKEVIALAKAKPGQLNYGSPGPLTSGHLSMELLNLQAGINITHIPYKGGAPAIIDLIGGRIQFMISGPPGVLPHIRAGRLKPIATTAAKRSPGLPDVLTKLSSEIARIIQLPEMSEKLAVQGAIPVGNSADEFARFVKGEMDQWGKVAQKIGLKPD